MNEVGAYFKEKLNKADFKRRNLENQVKCIENEFNKLTEREKSISVREDTPDYVFQVECFEKNLDDDELDRIMKRKAELEQELSDAKAQLQENKISVEKIRRLYDLSINNINGNSESKGLNSDIYNKLEFILQLMDNDIVRAKMELAGILKEESADAN